MKEAYFSLETIQTKALEMLQKSGADLRRNNFQYIPERSALLVLDMQTYFLESTSHAYIPSGRAIIPGIRDLILAFSIRRLPVIFTRHLNTSQDVGLMAIWWRDIITAENPKSEIIPELDLSAGIVLEKSQYDAFYQSPLESILRNRAVSQVVISGVMTHLCCETTARCAFVRGFEVFFLVDGTATYNEQFHQASLLNLSHGFASLMLAKDILTNL